MYRAVQPRGKPSESAKAGEAMQWSNLDPNDVIDLGLVAEYRHRRRIIHDQLVTLNIDTYTLRKIAQFPWPILVEQPAMVYWVGVTQKFFAYALGRVATCGTSEGGMLASVPRFAEWVHARVRQAYQLPLHYAVQDDVTFVHSERPLLAAARTSWTTPGAEAFEQTIQDVIGIPLERFEAVLAALNRIYDVLALDAGSVLLDVPNDLVEPNAPCDDRPDIVKVLDELALQSEVLYLPERQHELWHNHKLHVWPERAVQQFNAYRKRAGLPEA